mgnify:CR=1 FL=1
MKRILSIIAIAMLTVVGAYAQYNIPQYSSVATNPCCGRYEIIQSEIIRKLTFKVDKYEGAIYQLVSDKNDVKVWQLMDILGFYGPGTETSNPRLPNQINYQLFTGGNMAEDTYLINIHSGKTWILSEDRKTKETMWVPMDNYPF